MSERKIPWWLRRKEEYQPAKPASADYTVVSSVSRNLLGMLRENLVPGLLQSQDNIGLCSPADHSDIILGLYLYDVREDEDIRVNGLQQVDQKYLQYPPMFLDLHYMVTTYLTMDLRYRTEEEHRILGGVMQLFHDNPILESGPGTGNEDLKLELENMDIGEKMKLWSGFGDPYRLSLFYKVSPVRLESKLFTKVTRVKEIHIEAVPRTE